MRSVAVVAALVLVAAVCVSGDKLFTIRQNAQGDSQVLLVNPTDGSISAKSPVTFNYLNPLVETTVDAQGGVAYCVWIDEVHSVTNLLGFVGQQTSDSSAEETAPVLSLAFQYNLTGHFFFDLQFSESQQTLYGIDVVSQYGRTLSNFSLGAAPSTIGISHLVAMPMDWYVNASSFDQQTGQYFALLNMFPTLPNTTIAQKLVVANFAQPVTPPNPAPDQVWDLQPSDGSVIYHFIGWNPIEQTVYALGTAPSQIEPDADTTWLATINPATGASELVMAVETLETGSTFPGPLMIDPNSGDVYAYVLSRSTGSWSLVSLSGGVNIVAQYDAEWQFRQATYASYW